MITVRTLGPRDFTEAWRLSTRHPVENVSIRGKISQSGLEPALLGHDIVGAFEGRHLIGLLSSSTSLNPVETEPVAIPAFADWLGKVRRAGSIVGLRPSTLDLWSELSRRWPQTWRVTRDLRGHQLVLALDHDPASPVNPAVVPVQPAWADSYYAASVAMYTEEIGLTPVEPTGGYRRHVDELIRTGRAFGWWDGHRIVFKADVAAASGTVCQLGGVWLSPELRGQGRSLAALAAVVRWCRQRWPVVSLYVNDYNQPALHLYRRLGLSPLNQFATVLY
ncbi:MAG: GNAT family N-acetyltransferase [Propionibacteriaceae bacterium]|jgi:GNAT superfamily N-acetyltransferase|nr:GNAT family N-acetyltransferase [Propionibacteriaceae bacterium]